jgi:hypothetical protein
MVTAKRMKEKQDKKKPKDFDEEIDSDMAEDIDEEDVDQGAINTGKKGKAIEQDPFFNQEQDIEKNETIEERRLRMTKKLLEELQ